MPTCGYGLPAYILAAIAEGWNGTLVLKIYRHRGQYYSVKKYYYKPGGANVAICTYEWYNRYL